VFEDDFPLNGEQDGGGAGSVADPELNSNNEPGGAGSNPPLGRDGSDHDFTAKWACMFKPAAEQQPGNQKIRLNGNDACPIREDPLNERERRCTEPTATACHRLQSDLPEYESDGVTPSPLAGPGHHQN